MQRISAGRFRGRKLLPIPEGALGVRPTGSRVREAIFDRLQDSVIGASVLDLFAGSGALAFEMTSRTESRRPSVNEVSKPAPSGGRLTM